MNEENESVRDRLENLFRINDPKGTLTTATIGVGELSPTMQVQEIKEFNQEELMAIADLLGMSDLYLNN
ncbi:hypothetical protein KOM07_05205 [Lentilactobacillus sp. G22-6]|uniref:hypothetical protein n=1 Tax=Lentilactobacillus dabitei TaxID=2831523 RepID=UPI001C2642B5|nr:hypothetical protein [Lentilactobacillus dabitei]MBU9788936.1 hypothetical protein [Lentilactobacillus dabitei]